MVTQTRSVSASIGVPNGEAREGDDRGAVTTSEAELEPERWTWAVDTKPQAPVTPPPGQYAGGRLRRRSMTE